MPIVLATSKELANGSKGLAKHGQNFTCTKSVHWLLNITVFNLIATDNFFYILRFKTFIGRVFE